MQITVIGAHELHSAVSEHSAGACTVVVVHWSWQWSGKIRWCEFFRLVAVTDRHAVGSRRHDGDNRPFVRPPAHAPRVCNTRSTSIHQWCCVLQDLDFSTPGTSNSVAMEKEHALEEMMGKLGKLTTIFFFNTICVKNRIYSAYLQFNLFHYTYLRTGRREQCNICQQ